MGTCSSVKMLKGCMIRERLEKALVYASGS